MTDDDIRKIAEATLEHHKAATPGPWRFGMHAQGTRHLVDGRGYMFAQVDDDGNGRMAAHARTAAPELARAVLDLLRYRQAVLEALDEESEDWSHLEGSVQAIASVRAAIARKLEAGRG